MKKINRPRPNLDDTVDAKDIQGVLDRNHTTEINSGHPKRTLYGCFKFIAAKPTFAALGDYPILCQCIEWMLKNDQHFTDTEIKRSIRYFQDFSLKGSRAIVNSLIAYRYGGGV